MATILEPTTETVGDQRVVMRGVGWSGYQRALRTRGNQTRDPKLVYLDGDLYLMSPAYRHEEIAGRLACLVRNVVVGLDLPCKASRATTFRRQKANSGAEADESFYLASAPQIRGRNELDLRQDPPPDLVIEAVNTHNADESIEVWRRFKVPEVWVRDLKTLRILTLQADGQYAQVTQSVAFPFLSNLEIFDWATRTTDEDDTTWTKALRLWIHDVLAPRTRDLTNESKAS